MEDKVLSSQADTEIGHASNRALRRKMAFMGSTRSQPSHGNGRLQRCVFMEACRTVDTLQSKRPTHVPYTTRGTWPSTSPNTLGESGPMNRFPGKRRRASFRSCTSSRLICRRCQHRISRLPDGEVSLLLSILLRTDTTPRLLQAVGFAGSHCG